VREKRLKPEKIPRIYDVKKGGKNDLWGAQSGGDVSNNSNKSQAVVQGSGTSDGGRNVKESWKERV